MAKPEWGAKRICHNCGTRYYDMRRDPIVCPSCGAEFDPEAFLKSRRSRVVATEEPARPKKAKPEVVEEDEETVDDASEDEPDLQEEEGDADLADSEDAGDADETVEADSDDSDDSDDDEESFGEEDDDSLLEDASELGDDDVDVGVDEEDDESR